MRPYAFGFLLMISAWMGGDPDPAAHNAGPAAGQKATGTPAEASALCRECQLLAYYLTNAQQSLEQLRDELSAVTLQDALLSRDLQTRVEPDRERFAERVKQVNTISDRVDELEAEIAKLNEYIDRTAKELEECNKRCVAAGGSPFQPGAGAQAPELPTSSLRPFARCPECSGLADDLHRLMEEQGATYARLREIERERASLRADIRDGGEAFRDAARRGDRASTDRLGPELRGMIERAAALDAESGRLQARARELSEAYGPKVAELAECNEKCPTPSTGLTADVAAAIPAGDPPAAAAPNIRLPTAACPECEALAAQMRAAWDQHTRANWRVWPLEDRQIEFDKQIEDLRSQRRAAEAAGGPDLADRLRAIDDAWRQVGARAAAFDAALRQAYSDRNDAWNAFERMRRQLEECNKKCVNLTAPGGSTTGSTAGTTPAPAPTGAGDSGAEASCPTCEAAEQALQQAYDDLKATFETLDNIADQQRVLDEAIKRAGNDPGRLRDLEGQRNMLDRAQSRAREQERRLTQTIDGLRRALDSCNRKCTKPTTNTSGNPTGTAGSGGGGATPPPSNPNPDPPPAPGNDSRPGDVSNFMPPAYRGSRAATCAAAECASAWKTCSETNTCPPIDEDCGVPGTCSMANAGDPPAFNLMDPSAWGTTANADVEQRIQIKFGELAIEIVIRPVQRADIRSWFNPLGLLARRLVDNVERWQGSAGPRPLLNPRDLATIEKYSNAQAIGLPKGVHVLLADRGGSTGKTLAMQVLNLTGQPVRLSSMPFAIEPIKQQAQAGVQAAFNRLAKATAVNVDLAGYCVEFLKAPPSANQIFRLAPPAVQKKFASMSKVLRSAYRVQHAGLLRPDSNPAAYTDAIKQWAIWAVEQNLNEARFTEAFLGHTKKNVEAAGQQWSKPAEDMIRKVSPNRWRDIVKVLQGAGLTIPQ